MNPEKSGYELEVLSTQFYRHAYEYIKHMDQSKLLSVKNQHNCFLT